MRVRIEKVIQGGEGLAVPEDGRRIFVPAVLPGELVEVALVESKSGFSRAELLEILEPSPVRIGERCPYWGVCGGCDFQYAIHAEQIRIKEGIIRENFTRIGKIDEINLLPTEVGKPWEYRCRSRFHVDLRSRKAGFLGRNTNNLVPIDSCPVLTPKLNSLLKEPDLLIESAYRLQQRNHLVEVGALASGEQISLLGREIALPVLDRTLYASSEVFFQSNEVLLEPLVSYVQAHVVGDTVIDLYSGVGTFSAFVEAKRVIAVERSKRCLAFAKKNAPHSDFYTGNVANLASVQKGRIDTVIVDPPRVGFDRNLHEKIAGWGTRRIIYVSCNSVTLARDVGTLVDLGFTLDSVKQFDFYPQTFHHEAVAILSKGDAD